MINIPWQVQRRGMHMGPTLQLQFPNGSPKWSPFARCISRASCDARRYSLTLRKRLCSVLYIGPQIYYTAQTILEEVGLNWKSPMSSCTKRNQDESAAAEAYHARCSRSTLTRIGILQESEGPGSTTPSAVGPQHAKSPDYALPHSSKQTKIQVRRRLLRLPMLQHI